MATIFLVKITFSDSKNRKQCRLFLLISEILNKKKSNTSYSLQTDPRDRLFPDERTKYHRCFQVLLQYVADVLLVEKSDSAQLPDQLKLVLITILLIR